MEFLEHFRLGPLLMVTNEMPLKEYKKVLMQENMYALAYVPKEKMDQEFPAFKHAILVEPNLKGVLISYYYTQLYT